MARTFGMWSAAASGLTAIGIIRSFEATAQAEARYALDANGEPTKSQFVKGPKTFSATLEIDGTVPSAAAAVTIDSVTYKTTKVTSKYSGDGSVATVDVEGSADP
jgi:hypothetical protein